MCGSTALQVHTPDIAVQCSYRARSHHIHAADAPTTMPGHGCSKANKLLQTSSKQTFRKPDPFAPQNGAAPNPFAPENGATQVHIQRTQSPYQTYPWGLRVSQQLGRRKEQALFAVYPVFPPHALEGSQAPAPSKSLPQRQLLKFQRGALKPQARLRH